MAIQFLHARNKSEYSPRVFFQFRVAQIITMSPIFSIIGDSNVKRHLNPMNCRDRPLMSGCQLLQCGRFALLSETIRNIREETTVILVSCLTNFLTGSEEAGSSVPFRIEPILREAHQIITKFALEKPEVGWIIAPPMYRAVPLWYRDGMPEVMTKFSEVFRDRPLNVLLMSSFATPELETDGIHLTAYSGLAFVLHLFDSAISLLDSLTMPAPELSAQVVESARVLEDRVMSLEQDHRRLNKAVENKTAIDSELDDYQENLRNEAWFVIKGLAILPEGLGSKEWQDRAVQDVQGVVTIVLGEEKKIIVVVNKTARRKDAKSRYHVQFASLEDSKALRNKFGSFFLGGGDKRPPSIKHVSIDNLVTPATSVRIAILKVLAKRYQDSNPGSRAQVISYEPRPLIKLTPPSSASDRRGRTYHFIEAIKSLPVTFTKDELALIARQLSEKLVGQLRSLFVVISDDTCKKKKEKAPAPSIPSTAVVSTSPGSTSVIQSPESGSSGSTPPQSGKDKSKSTSSRGSKRGSSSPAEDSRKQKK